MTISVVIPALNEEHQLDACLTSLDLQELRPDQVIVVDNDSVDRTAEIARRHGAVVLNQPIRGISRARNLGFDSVTSDIIGRIDADSRLPTDWTKKALAEFKDSQILAVSGPTSYHSSWGPISWISERILIWTYFKYARKKLGHETLFGSNMAMRRSAWDQVKDEVCLDDANMHEDLDLAIHLAKYGQIKYDPTFRLAISPRAAWRPPLWQRLNKTRKTFKRYHRGTEV